jgi:hypothetical protein
MGFVGTTEARLERESKWNTPATPKFGFIQSSLAIMERGATTDSVLGAGASLSQEIGLRVEAGVNKEEGLTEEQFYGRYGENTSMKFQEDTPRRVWDYRRDRATELFSKEIRAAEAGGVRQFIGGSIGSMAADAPLMFVPFVPVLGRAKAAGRAVKAGNTLNAAKFGQGLKSEIWTATKQVATAGARQETLENAFIYTAAQYRNSDEYGLLDLAADTALQFPIRTAFGSNYIRKTAKHLKMNRDLLQARASIQSAYANGDVGHVTQVLAKYDKELDLVVKSDEEINEIVSRGANITPEEGKRVTQFLIDNQEKVWLKCMSQVVPFDARLATEPMKQKHQSEVMEAVNKVMEGRRDELSSEELKWVTEADADVQKALQDLIIRFDKDIKPIGPDGKPVVDTAGEADPSRYPDREEASEASDAEMWARTLTDGDNVFFDGKDKSATNLLAFLDKYPERIPADKREAVRSFLQKQAAYDSRIEKGFDAEWAKELDDNFESKKYKGYADSAANVYALNRMEELYPDEMEALNLGGKSAPVEPQARGRKKRPRREISMTRRRMAEKRVSLEEEASSLRSHIKTLSGSKKKSKQGTLAYLEKQIKALDEFKSRVPDRKKVPRKQGEAKVNPEVKEAEDLLGLTEELLSLAKEARKDSRKVYAGIRTLREKVRKAEKKAAEDAQDLSASSSKLSESEEIAVAVDRQAKRRVAASRKRVGDRTLELEKLYEKSEADRTLAEKKRIKELEKALDQMELTLKHNEESYARTQKALPKATRATERSRKKKADDTELKALQQELRDLESDPAVKDAEKIQKEVDKYESDVVTYRQYLDDAKKGEIAPEPEAPVLDPVFTGTRPTEPRAPYRPAPTQEKIAQTINDAERSVDPKKVAAEKRDPQVKEATDTQSKGAAEQKNFDTNPVAALKQRIDAILDPVVARLLHEPLDAKAAKTDVAGNAVTDQMSRKLELLEYLESKNFKKDDPIYKEYEKLFDDIFSFYGYMNSQRKQSTKVLKDLRKGKPIKTKLSDSMFMRLSQMVADGESDLSILSKMDELMHEEQLAFAMRSLHDFNVRQRHDGMRGKEPSTVLKYLQSYMDGTFRSEKTGEKRRTIHVHSSVDAQIKAQITLDQMPILEVLHETGFYDLFMGAVTGKYTDAYRFDKLSTVADQRAREVYGENLENASNAFIEDLMAYAKTGQVPVSWKDIPEFEKIAKIFKEVPEAQMGMLNKAGANIHMLDEYSGISHRWDENTIKKKGYPYFYKRMVEDVDWVATEKMHGGKLHKNLNDVEAARKRRAEGMPAEPTEWVDWDRDAFLRGWFTELGRPTPDMDHASMDIARSMSKSRRVILKSDKEAGVLKEFSGHKNLGRLYIDQVRYRSEMIGVANALGNQPIPNFNKVMKSHGIEAGINTTREGWFKDERHAHAVRHLSDTVRMATGALDNPVDKDLAHRARQVREVSNILYLPKAGISALNDVPGITSTLKYQGVNIGMLDMRFWASYIKNIARRFNGNRDEMSHYFLSEAAGMDSFLNAQSARFSVSEGSTGGDLISKLNEALFNMNFLNLITAAGQDTYIDLLSMDMGRQIAGLKKGDQAWHSLNDFGFSPQEIADLGKYVGKTADGVERISSSMVPDPELSRKLREYQIFYMNNAVITPDLGTQATVRMGQQDGTWRGVAARNTLQYMSFPMATSNIHFKRYIHGYNESQGFNTRTRMMGHMSGWIGGAMAMGYVSMVLKDLAAGREPMLLHNMTAAGIGRVYNSSGVGGVLDPLLGGIIEREVPVAPLVTLPLEIFGADSGAQALHRARPLYGSAYPILGPVISMMMGTALGDALPLYYEQKKGEDFFERKYNQGKFVKAWQNYGE